MIQVPGGVVHAAWVLQGLLVLTPVHLPPLLLNLYGDTGELAGTYKKAEAELSLVFSPLFLKEIFSWSRDTPTRPH